MCSVMSAGNDREAAVKVVSEVARMFQTGKVEEDGLLKLRNDILKAHGFPKGKRKDTASAATAQMEEEKEGRKVGGDRAEIETVEESCEEAACVCPRLACVCVHVHVCLAPERAHSVHVRVSGVRVYVL